MPGYSLRVGRNLEKVKLGLMNTPGGEYLALGYSAYRVVDEVDLVDCMDVDGHKTLGLKLPTLHVLCKEWDCSLSSKACFRSTPQR